MTQLLHSPVTLPESGDFQRIEVTQVGGVIGAIVSGIRVGGDVEPAALTLTRCLAWAMQLSRCVARLWLAAGVTAAPVTARAVRS